MKKGMIVLGSMLLLGAAYGWGAQGNSLTFENELYQLNDVRLTTSLLDTVPVDVEVSDDGSFVLNTYVLAGKTFENTTKWIDIQYLANFNEIQADEVAGSVSDKATAAGFDRVAPFVYGCGGRQTAWIEPATAQDPNPKLVIQRFVKSKGNGAGKIIRFVYQDKPAKFEKLKNTSVPTVDAVNREVQTNVFGAWFWSLCSLKLPGIHLEKE